MVFYLNDFNKRPSGIKNGEVFVPFWLNYGPLGQTLIKQTKQGVKCLPSIASICRRRVVHYHDWFYCMP